MTPRDFHKYLHEFSVRHINIPDYLKETCAEVEDELIKSKHSWKKAQWGK